MKNINIEKEQVINLAELFKNFSDPTRIKILLSLYDKELCVNDIASNLSMSQSSISHQLKTLKQSKLIKGRREGQLIYYSLDDEHVYKIIEQGSIHINE